MENNFKEYLPSYVRNFDDIELILQEQRAKEKREKEHLEEDWFLSSRHCVTCKHYQQLKMKHQTTQATARQIKSKPNTMTIIIAGMFLIIGTLVSVQDQKNYQDCLSKNNPTYCSSYLLPS